MRVTRRVRSLACVALAGACLTGTDAAAQAIQNIVLRNSFNPLGAGARGLGMGGAFIAVADDGTASSFNPAGLAQLRRTEISLVGFQDELTSTLSFVRDGQAQSAVSESSHSAPDFAGLAVPFELGGRQLTVQLSYQRSVDLFGRGSAVTQDTYPLSELGIDPRELGLPPSFRSVTLVSEVAPEQSGAFHTVSASAGYQATSRLALGLAVNYWLADWASQGDATTRLLVSTPAGPGRPPTVLELLRSDRRFVHDQSLRGFNLTTGFQLRYARLSLGGVLRLPFTGDYDLLQEERTSASALGQRLPDEDNDLSMASRLHWPRSAGVGIALRPFRGLTLAADYTRSNWSRTFIADVPDGALLTPLPEEDDDGFRAPVTFRDLNFFDLSPASQTTTGDTSQWRAGGEYLVSLPKVVVPLRAGVFNDRSPVRQIDSDQGRRIRGWTIGTGLNFSRLVLDLAFERRTSEALVGLVFRGGSQVAQSQAPREKVRTNRIVASLIYRFGGADDPLKRALQYLLVGAKDESTSEPN